MARPIQATPKLKGADAKSLLNDLKQVCPPTEAQRRVKSAREQLGKMMLPRQNAKACG